MIKIFNLKNISADEILSRSETDYSACEKTVDEIIQRVKRDGDKALYEFAEKFDRAKLAALKVTDAEIDGAFASCDGEFICVVEKAMAKIEKFHAMQLRQGFEYQTEDGAILGQKLSPVEKACVYVPGGTASYPSSVLMNVIPARLAGVKEIYMATPPSPDGSISADILVAAKTAGVKDIYKIGGAQAVAAFAYGTQSVPKVDKIVGPGNIYVATAKKRVFGEVGIDMIAGPSEILVIADGSARAKDVAADLLSQAEHDKLATAILITDSASLAEEVKTEIENQLESLSRADIARASIENNGKIIVADSIDAAIDIANRISPEHLELAVENPYPLLKKIKNAGSVFLGYWTPEAAGDYFAGANHTLPTGGTARFSSALSVDDFIKKTQYIYYSQKALENECGDIMRFAESEGLTAHARSVGIRFED